MADDFDNLWGTSGATSTPAPTGTTVLDPQSFDKAWLTSPPVQPKQDTDNITSTINAATGSAINAIPVIGPSIKSGTEKLSSRIRSLMYGTKYEDELANVQDYVKQSEAAHPAAATVGTIGGTVYPYLVGAGLAPRAFGVAGNLAERVGFGAGTNALINGADTAARGGTAKEVGENALVGGSFGGGLPLVGRGIGAAGSAVFGSSDGATNALAAKAESMGIPIYASQTTGSPFVAKASQMAGKLPGSGMGDLIHEQQSGFNKAVARTFGEDADRITPDVMSRAKARIGSDFDAVANNTTVKADSQFLGDIHGIINDADSALVDSEKKVLHNQIGNILDKVTGAGEIDGKTYQALTRKGAPLDRAMQSNDPNVKFYAGKVRNALDDALERSASGDDLARLKTARSQYKSMKTIEDLAEKSPTGDISAPLLMGAVRNSNGNMAYGGGGELADLARIGQRFMRAPADSGTPTGEAALNLLVKGGIGLSALAGGAGYAGYNSGYDPISMLKGAAALPATMLLARGATTALNRPQALNALLQRSPALVPSYNQLSQQQ